MSKKMTDRKWEALVRIATPLIGNTDVDRMKVAEIALDACEVYLGGKNQTKYTLALFAGALGMNRKTLYNWCDTYRSVFKKLPVKVQAKRKDLSFEILCRVYARVRKGGGAKTPVADVRKIFKEEGNVNPDHLKFMKYAKVVNAVIHNGANPVKLMDIPENLILDLQQKCNLASNLLLKELKFRQKHKKPSVTETQLDEEFAERINEVEALWA